MKGGGMKERNLYKDIVVGAFILALVVVCSNLWKKYLREQETYSFSIQSDQEITEHTAGQLQNITGLCRFEPEASVMVEIKLEEYTLEAKLAGVDLERRPLGWKEAGQELALGNTSALFFGEDVFGMFCDKHGYRPDKKQIKLWMNHYQELLLSIADGAGHTKRGRVCGILKSPSGRIFMDKNQMEEVFRESFEVTGGYMEVYGYTNMEKAKDALESGGFLVEEEKN